MTTDYEVQGCSAELYPATRIDQASYCDSVATRMIDGFPWCDEHQPIEEIEPGPFTEEDSPEWANQELDLSYLKCSPPPPDLEEICLATIVVSSTSTISYSEVADRMGLPSARSVEPLLVAMNARRDAARLPDLGCVVVNKITGEVGMGWYGIGRTNPKIARHRAHEHALFLRG